MQLLSPLEVSRDSGAGACEKTCPPCIAACLERAEALYFTFIVAFTEHTVTMLVSIRNKHFPLSPRGYPQTGPYTECS
jgi:hypothetical protein